MYTQNSEDTDPEILEKLNCLNIRLAPGMPMVRLPKGNIHAFTVRGGAAQGREEADSEAADNSSMQDAEEQQAGREWDEVHPCHL